MTIKRLKTVPQENWYIAQTQIGKAIAIGFGTTISNAIEQCLNDVLIIRKIQGDLQLMGFNRP